MPRHLPRPAAALLAAVALTGGVGCSMARLDVIRADVAAGHGHLVEGVPFFPQEAGQCGPAALAMVLGFHGVPVDPDEIGRALSLGGLGGTLNLELEFHARRRGLATRAESGSLAGLRDEVRADRPLIVLQDLGAVPGLGPPWSVPHYAVVVGFDDRAGVVVLHSGTTPFRVVPYAEFERTWAAGRWWALRIMPAAAPR